MLFIEGIMRCALGRGHWWVARDLGASGSFRDSDFRLLSLLSGRDNRLTHVRTFAPISCFLDPAFLTGL